MENKNNETEHRKKAFLKKNTTNQKDTAENKNAEKAHSAKTSEDKAVSEKQKAARQKKFTVRVVKKSEKPAPTEKEQVSPVTTKDSAVLNENKKPLEPAKAEQGKKEPTQQPQPKKTVPAEKKTIVSRGTESDSMFQKRPDRKAGNLAGGKRSGFNRTGRDFNRDGQSGGQGENSSRKTFTGSDARNFAGGRRPFQSNSAGGGKKLGMRPRPQGGTAGSFGQKFQGGQGQGSPMPIDSGKNAKKQTRARKSTYDKKDHREDFEEKAFQHKKRAAEALNAVPAEIEMLDSITVSELAKKMNLKAATLIAKLMEMGMMVTMNQAIDYDTAAILADEYNCKIKHVSLYDETVIETESDEGAELKTRPPVVTIMGHVDHGKTKTLDAIRRTNVAAGEFGGITQHIGAYTVNTPGGRITFLDTPGHEAFTMMRARGAAVTDIVVLVVAADDGVMPQTIEAINHAKDANVPIIVAINKIDKPEANPEKVMTRLSELGLMPESWGGTTMYVEISALKGLGIDKLLETILLQAEVLELAANYNCRAEGKVVESRIDHGRGIVATILVQRGTLKTGDAYVAGIYSGHVRAIFNDKGENISEAGPSMPVEILGLEGMPNAGDPFQVASSEKEARQISEKRQELKRFEASQNLKKVTLDNLYSTISDGEMLELKVIVKGDVQGSVEAVKQSLEKLSTKEIRLNVIHASAGAINESDVMLAAADSNALIIGFNVRPTPQAKHLAEQEKVDIRKYNIIYEAVEEMKLAMEGMLSPDIKEKVIGMAEVREVFKVPKLGRIAGLYVTEGVIKRSASINVIRDGIVVFSGKLASLKRFKDDAREVAAGFECGAGLENYNDVEVGDQFEVIEKIEVARKLNFDEAPKEKTETPTT